MGEPVTPADLSDSETTAETESAAVPDSSEPAAPALTLEIRKTVRVNAASAQNNVGVLHAITLTNHTERPLETITLSMRAEPPLLRSKTWQLDRIAAGTSRTLESLSTAFDTARLSALNEAEVGALVFTVDGPDGPLCEERHTIEFLARDEWGGVGDMAHLLAAFVSPNDAVVAALLRDASELLERSGYPGGLDGYRSGDPQRAWLLAGAIWSAATGMGLHYAHPPASFETAGQKVRGPGRIKAEGLATCLDTALLLAAAFEAAGLNSVVLFTKGHAFVGVWLVPRDFGYVTEPDIVAVRKAVQAREFVPIETTLLTRRPTVGLEQAVAEGRRQLSEEHEDRFVTAVDVARARAARIRPLATTTAEAVPEDHAEAAPTTLPKPLDGASLPADAVDDVPQTPRGRIERWQRKLLDLSLRNRLLNFKATKQTVPLMAPDMAALEDALAGGKRFKTYALIEDDPVGTRQFSAEERKAIELEAAGHAYGRGQVAIPLTEGDMKNRLLALFRRAKSDMQEGGTNTLFLAAGFLRWKRDGEARTYRAPLLLIPVALDRRSAQSDFTLTHHEDDVRFNATLLEFLQRDFDLTIPELSGELPRDESGIDVPGILEIVRRKVRDVAGFEVVEDLFLSTFSFAKYLMWKDLVERTDQLRENPLVRHLVDNPEAAFSNGETPPLTPRELDTKLTPRDLVTPLPADSSQLAAVVAAAEGRNFVLIGPPGTGKSQTISNIIAQCLATGRTVLFVAEKAAALDVVHRRLAAYGLSDAVLELHSNKTDRKAVLTQLGNSWQRATGAPEDAWIDVTDQLRIARDSLNAYVQALHARGRQGFSIFEAIGWLAAAPDGLTIGFSNKDAHDAASFAGLERIARELSRTHAVAGDGPPLTLVASGDWSHAWEAAFLDGAAALLRAVKAVRASASQLSAMIGLCADPALGPERRKLLAAFAARTDQAALDVSRMPDLPPSAIRQHVEAFAADANAIETARRAMAARYPDAMLPRIPLAALDGEWRQAAASFWPLSWLSKRKVRKLLQTYADAGVSDPARDLPALFTITARQEALAASPLAAAAGSNAEPARLAAMAEQAAALRHALRAAAENAADHVCLGSAAAALAAGPDGPLRDALLGHTAAEAALAHALAHFNSIGGAADPAGPLAALNEALDLLFAQKARISDWTRWMEARHHALAGGLAPLVEAVENRRVDDAALTFRRAYARWWLPLALDASPELRRFAHWDHEHIVETFRRLDEEAARVAPSEIMRRIQHGLPEPDGVARKSELGALRHQLGLQRPSMPIRTLLSSIGSTLPKLAPCVLMSPLSIAQYLPAGQAAFDVVIFDEASQITTWDAVGAIARGRQAIIVGDPKQLPPSNFFGRTDDDEELPEVERDPLSILDEVATAGIPTRELTWHYRSRDEALIAFSNHFYYGGRLVTFPAPIDGTSAVAFHKVDGIYARGSGRTNQIEAKAVATFVSQRLTAWLTAPESERQTLGVITFNSQQQGLIQDLLDDVLRDDPRLEWFFSDDRDEPVIVKNLENIQGDERDVMLFSITFGPSVTGTRSMNFGALNAEGGEKRLNVAVTRARRELHVFSSIDADWIDLSRSGKTGVKHLKAFLDYAARGPVALPAADEGSLGPAENPFEAAIADAFRRRGWEVRTQIGVSNFRIDLAIVHPDHGGAFIAGIECDGASYHASATARDRDKIRQAVLEGLGWTILRIWSTDWFRAPDAVADRLHETLQTLLESDRDARAQKDAAAAAARAVSEADDSRPGHLPERLALAAPLSAAPDPAPPRELLESASPLPLSAQAAAPGPSAAPAQRRGRVSPEELEAALASMIEQAPPERPAPASAATAESGLDADRFFEPDYAGTLGSLVAQIAQAEGPLPLSVLCRMVAARHGWQRTGRRIAARVENCLALVSVVDEFGVPFVWPQGASLDRVPFGGLRGRAVRDVSRTEIADVIANSRRAIASAEDGTLELARAMAIARLTADTRAYLDLCRAWAVESGPQKESFSDWRETDASK
ncbi:DUF3320 domain-containing protein [Acuticoccus sp. MNP-M23]|uniref:DUF3320 domain-containing protein n=1 Tax=Acuticoccus sp. MNP-M23 TaxID=3072793 RepID=UPI0028160A46|nr:DUF3320 domain-containing protein [Acuticoccus sp. MNP-M23]WMS41581.1 DUF3320 domain-containing protein [Acuticoccus sp. MNP-M23]